MKTLIVEDDFICRTLLMELLKNFGPAHLGTTGKEAVDMVRVALDANEPYDLICLDIMMPEMDGQQALHAIRAMEYECGRGGLDGARIIMTTALNSPSQIMTAFREQCDGYLVKPINKQKLYDLLQELELLQTC